MKRTVVIALACLAALAVAAPAHAAKGARLLAKHQPVTVFAPARESHPAELFRPVEAEAFVADSNLEMLTGPNEWTVVDPAPTPATLPTASPPIWRLNQRDCSAAAGPLALPCYAAGAAGSPNVVYGRVVETEKATVLQYWFFYYHNLYSYHALPFGAVWQAHEGDWEVVNVVLNRGGEPRYVGYSQHCSGERRGWAKTPRWNGHHPIVFVARGSHANYFSAGIHTWDPRCLQPDVIGFFAQQGLPLPADETGHGAVAGPARLGAAVAPIERISATSPAWIAFPGFWGELQYLHAPTLGTQIFGTSPVGPAFQATWQTPLAAMATWPRS